MQRIFNYGSFLQAYSLKKIIENMGYNVRFIDYHPGNTIIPSKNGKLTRKIVKGIDAIKLQAPLSEKIKFIKYKKNYAQNYFSLLGINEYKDYTTKNLDTLVIGSDEVFNCVQSNPNVGFSPDLFGANCQAMNLISYAASFGDTTLDKLNKYHLDKRISKWLKNFDAISVRDKNSESIITKLIGAKPNVNLDPVLIYFDKKTLTSYLKKPKIKEKYLILYGYNGRFSLSECKAIREFANKRNLKILCIGGIQHCCDEFIDCDPFEVLSYFNNAEFIITDTFHGTIMSIINEKKFAVIVRDAGYGNAQKLNDLLDRLDLKEQKVSDLKKIDVFFSTPIKYLNVNKKLKQERNYTIKFLSENL